MLSPDPSRKIFRALALAFLLLPALHGGVNAQNRTDAWPTNGWLTSSPEQEGMSSGELALLVDFGLSNGMDSLLVVRHGKIVTEAYYAPFRADTKHRINSATKSVIGSLVAVALKEGLLKSVDQRVVDFFSDRTIANNDEMKKAMTLQTLLDMTSGLDWVEPLSNATPWSLFALERSPDWVQSILDYRMIAAPGTTFNYNSGNPHLLSAILSKVTGRSALDYATEKLFKPLGIADVLWRHDPQGVSTGGLGLYLQPRDMAKIGYLYLRNGMWEGQQIVPPPWIDKVRHATVDMRLGPDLRYANLFWTMPSKDVYMAVGYHRQLIMIMPNLDIVAVMTGSSHISSASGVPSLPVYSLSTAIGQLVSAVKSDEPLPDDPPARALLEDRVRNAATETPSKSSDLPGLTDFISNKVYRFKENPLRLKSFSMSLDGPNLAYEYEADARPMGTATERYGGPIGLDGNYRIGGRRQYGLSVAKRVWLADTKTFELDVQTLGNDDAAKATLTFEGKSLELKIQTLGNPSITLRGQSDD